VAAVAQLTRAGSGGVSDPHARQLASIASVAKLQAVEAAIGTLAADLCRACIVRDMPWAETARLTHRDPHTVRDWTVLAIRALARAWVKKVERKHDEQRSARRIAALSGV
jgi:hypothetical protein